MSTINEIDDLTEVGNKEILSDEDEDPVPPPPSTAIEYDEEGNIIEDDDDDDDDDDDNDDDIIESFADNQVDTEHIEIDHETGAVVEEPISAPISIQAQEYSDSEDDDSDNEKEYNKLELNNYSNTFTDYHPSSISHNNEEINAHTKIIRDKKNIIVDDLHKTIPFLTKYEKTRVLGQRAKQIENGHKPFVRVADNVIDSYIIALQELEQKKIPFIIRRPLPSGGSEYWNLKDLEII